MLVSDKGVVRDVLISPITMASIDMERSVLVPMNTVLFSWDGTVQGWVSVEDRPPLSLIRL